MINFEQIIDSKLKLDFVPFISFRKKLDTTDKPGSGYRDLMIQAFYWNEDQLRITNSEIVSLKWRNQETI